MCVKFVLHTAIRMDERRSWRTRRMCKFHFLHCKKKKKKKNLPHSTTDTAATGSGTGTGTGSHSLRLVLSASGTASVECWQEMHDDCSLLPLPVAVPPLADLARLRHQWQPEAGSASAGSARRLFCGVHTFCGARCTLLLFCLQGTGTREHYVRARRATITSHFFIR